MSNKIEYICAIGALICAVVAFILGIISNTSVVWIVNSIIWISVSIINLKNVDKLEKVIKNYEEKNKLS